MDMVMGKKLTHVDCTAERPSDQYFACGEVKVVSGPAGLYREAEARPLSRFGYRFRIEQIGKPHLALIRYPDDRRRFMIINDGTCYDLSTGITTGHAYPLSHAMQEIRQVFWPRWQDCSICFMTWSHGEAAAAASFEIYEIDAMPALALDDCQGREFGIQYEDPCGIGGAEGAMNFAEWLDHVVAYARFTGQSLLSYPICWYHGPQFPSKREPADGFNVVVARDRKQYSTWTTEPPDWPAVLLDRFSREGMAFQGVLTLLRLGSLMQRMNTDLPAIQAGADTINNMLWCDEVRTGTGDWTPLYNARNYPEVLKRGYGNPFPFAYGEQRSNRTSPPGPIFNPLHPVVQEAVVGFIAEIGQRYGCYPAFKGIAITMWTPTIIWFGSLHAGYDDTTTDLFEQETGVKIPVDHQAPNRFSQRFMFLTTKCRPLWLEWRCKKIRDLILRMRDALTAGRSDLTLTLNLWSEPLVPALYGNGQPTQQIYARPNGKEIYREAGLDVDLLVHEANIRLDLQLEGGGRDRTGHYHPQENTPMEWFFMFRDHDFLDRETSSAVYSQAKPGIFIFNAWHEAWGNHQWFPCEPDDENQFQLAEVYGKKAQGIFRMNSKYPEDGFWWDSQLRITHAFPPNPHFMEQYAHAVAEVDACRITRGGLFLDKAHSDELRRFAAVYRKLPAVKFDTVGTSADPVAVRTKVHHGKRYVYLINREYYPVTVFLTCDPAPVLTDLTDGTSWQMPATGSVVLQPYELRAYVTGPEIAILSFTVAIPDEQVKQLDEAAGQALTAIKAVRQSGYVIAGLDRIESDLRQCHSDKAYSRLRHLLMSYPVQKSLTLTGVEI